MKIQIIVHCPVVYGGILCFSPEMPKTDPGLSDFDLGADI